MEINKIKNFEIINDIAHCTIHDYTSIINEFKTFFETKYQGKLSLYQFGNTAHPSVSDLDLAIVIDEETIAKDMIKNIIQDAKNFVQANETRAYIFTHDILIYSKLTFMLKGYIHFTSNLTLLSGIPIPVEDVSDNETVNTLHLISYFTNTLRDFEGTIHNHQVGLRKILKMLQNAYHELTLLETCKSFKYDKTSAIPSEKIRHMRTMIIRTPWNHTIENELQAFYMVLYSELQKIYTAIIEELSIKIFGYKITGYAYVPENKHLVKRHRAFIRLAAAYGIIFQDSNNCYAKIHQTMFPVKTPVLPLEPFLSIIKKQSEALIPACKMKKKYNVTQVIGPMMCYHCAPEVSKKQKLTGTIRHFLLFLQGV